MPISSKSKILITGNLGYIGSILTKEVKSQGFEFFGIDKEPQSGADVLSFNLCDEEKTLNAIAKFKPDIIIHAGSHSALIYKDNLYDPFLEDFGSLKNIVTALKNLPDSRLVYFSSSYVYSGLVLGENYVEDSALKPMHNFGVAKSFFEQFILRNHKNSVIFRLCSVFGQGEARHPNTILLFVKEALEKGQINVWGQGNRKLQYVYSKDVVNYALKSQDLLPGLYNLGGSEYVSVAEAGAAIVNFFKVKLSFLKDKSEGETLPYLSNEKIKNALGNMFTPFPEALNKYLKTIKQ